ncbi:MAG: response regulator [Thermodesulfobacteriota bacterium]|nr:MAG: response regulator [Thermodesulfobacteriota bacterium]
MKVIVVDDSLVMRKIIVNVVESLGYEGVHATNGKNLLEILEHCGGEVGLVLLDWNMPGINGIEALKTMQKDSRFRAIPVFMISTESEDAKVGEALKTGAKGYLAKPFTPEELAAKIKDILG